MELGNIAEIIGGKNISRYIVKEDELKKSNVKDERIIVPKAINEGFLDIDYLETKKLLFPEGMLSEKDYSKKGDIIIKLSSPNEACVITENEEEKCIFPTFVAKIRLKNYNTIDLYYLLAFLNSSRGKKSINTYLKGNVVTILSLSDLKKLDIPLWDDRLKKEKISTHYKEYLMKKKLLDRIIVLENQKNDLLFEKYI